MIEIIPRQSQETSREVSFSYYFIVSLLIFSIAGYFFLNSMLNKTKAEIEYLEASLSEIMTAEKTSFEQNILLLEDKINNYYYLVQEHKQASRAISFLEENVHPEILFLKLEILSDKNQVNIIGQAEKFESLGQQIFIFQNQQDYLYSVALESTSINRQGKIDFKLNINFKPEIFSFQPSVVSEQQESLYIEEKDLIDSEDIEDTENIEKEDLIDSEYIEVEVLNDSE